jgi:hypothetical protein
LGFEDTYSLLKTTTRVLKKKLEMPKITPLVVALFAILIVGASVVATLVPTTTRNAASGGVPCPVPLGCLPTSYEELTVNDLVITGNITCPGGSCVVNVTQTAIETINTIPPWNFNNDFDIVGVHGIQVTGLPHGIELKNTGIIAIIFLSPHPEFNGTLVNGVLFLTKNPQLANTFFAGPESGPDAQPLFRYLIDDDLPNISAYKVNGTLQVSQGGTGSSIPLEGGRLMISWNGNIIEGPAIFGNETFIEAGPGIVVDVVNGTFIISASPRITSVDLQAPPGIFNVTSPVFTDGPAVLSFDVLEQFANTFWAAPDGIDGFPTFRFVTVADLPNGIPFSKLTGILPISMGGTNSGAPLVNNRIMVSFGGEIVESQFENGTGITISIHDGGIEVNNDGLLGLTVSAPSDLLGVAGSPTSGNAGNIVLSKQPVAANAVYAGPPTGTGNKLFR